MHQPRFSRLLLLTIVKLAAGLKSEPRCNVPDSEWAYSKLAPGKGSGGNGRLAVFEKGQLWTNATVHYVIDAERLSEAQIDTVHQAIAEYHSKTCIRFKPWSSNSESPNYINVTLAQDGDCSLAEVCMRSGQQLVQLGEPCWFKGMVVHQLGHALCLGHENQRPIRDVYLDYGGNNCSDSEIPSKLENNEGQLGFYDYASQMHFACGSCSGGWPRDQNVTKCGYQASEGLSLLDADYLNLLYGCGGCHRHRWVPLDKLKPEDHPELAVFGFKDDAGDSLYPCRASFAGEVLIGKFTWRHKICSFSLDGKEYYQTGASTELLLVPGGLQDNSSEYQLENINWAPAEPLLSVAVPSGRTSERDNYNPGYVAFARIRSPINRKYEDVIGKAWKWGSRIPYAYFPIGGEEIIGLSFKVLTCRQEPEPEPVRQTG